MLRWSAFLLIVGHYQKQLLDQPKVIVQPLRFGRNWILHVIPILLKAKTISGMSPAPSYSRDRHNDILLMDDPLA
jgi:hypothetical protein